MGEGSTNTPHPWFSKEKGANFMVPRENVGAQTFPVCKKCGKTHKEECFIGSNAFFKCGKSGHQARDCRGGGGMPQGQIAHVQQVQRSGQCTNHFYVLYGRQEVEEVSNIVTGILKVFAFDVYALLDPGANLSFVTPFLANRFDMSPKMLLDPYLVSTPIGELVHARKVYKGSRMFILHKWSLVI
ncbi:uncharacterized protein LOC129899823 [Solanum dulcamara]|uniref:uncharacterized protein LOC129899823 n=1 Tax=Solanum dulcamara TaxID=45834 RepID=UPI0024855517|nr:uncharacterized protein LOC129899823 [Solanum dulcamara]